MSDSAFAKQVTSGDLGCVLTIVIGVVPELALALQMSLAEAQQPPKEGGEEKKE